MVTGVNELRRQREVFLRRLCAGHLLWPASYPTIGSHQSPHIHAMRATCANSHGHLEGGWRREQFSY